LGISDDEAIFLLVSYDLKKKGIRPLVEAAGQLRRAGSARFRVVVVGGLPPGSVRRRIRKLDLESVFFFEGRVDSAEAYFAEADVFVLPTFYDACSLVVFEAMACGLPVITSEANGAAGVLSSGKEGYVISHPPSAAALAEKMRRLMDPSVRSAMSAAARNTAEGFTVENNHREMIRVLAAAAAERRQTQGG
jgi:UDP-glucose:(heptosyl)LPS alpha-1,3-glucosyltransferase